MLAILLCLFLPASAAMAETESFGGSATMNGYSVAQFPDFQKKWHFVTVRYRKDSGEMRFTYANDSAWAALLAGGKDYPNGAVFAKIGMATEEDPGFVSSAVPSGARRIQLMVRDKKKHSNTDGWGYALFNGQGVTYPEDPKKQEIACAACHRLVPGRNYVFSEPLDLDNLLSPTRAKSDLPGTMPFAEKKTAKLSAHIKKFIPASFAKTFLLQGDLQKSLFQGTLDEIRPVLAKKAVETNSPAALLSLDGQRFSLVLPDPESKICNGGAGKPLKTITTAPAGAGESMLSYCYGN